MAKTKKLSLVAVEHGREPKQKQIMRNLGEQGICPFCPEGLKKCKLKNVRELHFWTVADSGFPYEGTKAHVLFIARSHAVWPLELWSDGWRELFSEVDNVAQSRQLRGYTLVLRLGEMNRSAASLKHLHVHLIAGNATSEMQRSSRAEYLLVPVGYKKKSQTVKKKSPASK